MRTTAKLGAILAGGALAIAVPAAAKPPTQPAHPSHPATPNNHSGTNPSTSHKCAVHKEAYIASGKVVSWSATSTDGRHYTGTIVVDVTQTNHHAAMDKGPMHTYTLTDTSVHFGMGATPLTASGDRIVLIGKITAVSKKCTDKSAAGTITLRKVDVSVPKGKQHT